jgi:hypothetical protein
VQITAARDDLDPADERRAADRPYADVVSTA